MKTILTKAVEYSPDLVVEFILELYDRLDIDGKAVFKANSYFYFFDDGTPNEEEKGQH